MSLISKSARVLANQARTAFTLIASGFAGRMIHESAHTKSKTLAREAERQRRRKLEERITNVKKRQLPPSFERASCEWLAGRALWRRSKRVRRQSATSSSEVEAQ
jgi:hypothetical protein